MSKEEIVKEVITILDTSSYIDPAEHLYDGLKQIKREITYATVHDFLWALESSTVIDVDGRVTECANKIKPLLADMTIDEAYENYVNKHSFDEIDCHSDMELNKPNETFIPYNQEGFINKCKNNPEFSEKWGLKIKERELSLEERLAMVNQKNIQDIISDIPNARKDEEKGQRYLDYCKIRCDIANIATKLITITYNDKTIESYD
jgi:hypothetical protein